MIWCHQLICIVQQTSNPNRGSGPIVELDVPPTNCSTIGDQAFSVAATQVWNDLPSLVTSLLSLAIFRQR